MMSYPDKHFFDKVRPLFGGRLSTEQVDGMNRIVQYAMKNGYSKPDLAYILATVLHETGKWMQPIREGALRFGPSYSDASAKRAVATLKTKGIIRTNYALPAGPYKQSYYGRGLVQITWYDNYLKFEKLLGIPLTQNPDLALEWDTALPILFIGMRDGMFRKASLLDVPDVMSNPASEFEAEDREIVNGDVKKYGQTIADYAVEFYYALDHYTPVQPEPAKKEDQNEPQDVGGSWPPRWWPFRAD